MALTEHKKQIAMKIAEKFGDVTLESVVFNNGDNVDSAFTFEAFVEGLLDSMPKPDPVGAIKELGKRLAARLDEDNWNYIEPFLRECEAPIAQPATAPSEQKPFDSIDDAIEHAIEVSDREGCSDCGGQHRQLAGWLVELRGMRNNAPQPDYKAQRDATQAISDVIAERHRQQSVEGWTPEHDDQHKNGELALAASAYALNSVRSHQLPPHWWPWAPEYWKPTTARRDLVKAAALILARVEQIDRAAIASVKGGE